MVRLPIRRGAGICRRLLALLLMAGGGLLFILPLPSLEEGAIDAARRNVEFFTFVALSRPLTVIPVRMFNRTLTAHGLGGLYL